MPEKPRRPSWSSRESANTISSRSSSKLLSQNRSRLFTRRTFDWSAAIRRCRSRAQMMRGLSSIRSTRVARDDVRSCAALRPAAQSFLTSATSAARLVWVRDRLRQSHDHPDFSNLGAVTGYDGAARAPRKNGVNYFGENANAFCLGIMPFDRSLCFCERCRKGASCRIATCHRSSQPGCDPKLRHSGWCADLSRRHRSGWSADRPRRPACLR
jgi:hypothetical protein